MSQKSKIEWTDATWNPVRGCSRVSEGCRNCYAERIAARGLPGHNSPTTGEQFAVRFKNGEPHWTGKVELIESALDAPLHWKKPRRIFVNSMSDLLHEGLTVKDIYRVFAVMELCPQHTFQVLTKRASRLPVVVGEIYGRANMGRVLPNVHFGVSCENQETANARIGPLLQTPAAVRFLSLEPLLGPIDVYRSAKGFTCAGTDDGREHPLRGINQVIVGGESGPGARPMNPDWVRSIRDQCVAAGVPFFFKQWGEWAPNRNDASATVRVGKKAAGRLLDGRTWDERA